MTSPSRHLGTTTDDVPERVRISNPTEAPVVAMSGPPAPWSSPREACVLIARSCTLPTGVVVASVVGTVHSSVNEGTVIASGHLGTSMRARVASNLLVLVVVASVGYLAPFRRRRGTSR